MKDLLEQVKDEEGKIKDKYEGKHRIYLYMKIFYGFFISWMGYNLLIDEHFIGTNQKYLGESLTYIKNVTNFYYPNLLSNEKLTKFFDYNTLLNKTYEITIGFSYLFIVGGFLVSVGLKIGKITVVIGLLLNVILVYNIFYFKGETLKVNVFKFWSYLGGALYL